MLPSTAIQVSDVVNPRQANSGWVSDQANLLSDSAEAHLNALLTELEASNGAEVAVVTVPDVAPSSSPRAFTTELFNAWEIGKKGQDNGVLVMVSKGDRRVEIETGYGMEAILPDARVGKIISTEMIPAFKQENYEAGIVNGTLAVAIGIEPEIKLPEIFPEALIQKATALVQERKQEALFKQQAAERQEANRIAKQERNERIITEQATRLPLYILMSAVGATLVGIGLRTFLRSIRSQIAAVQTLPLAKTVVHPMEIALNPDSTLTRGTLHFAIQSAWIYELLAIIGFAILSAGLMGLIVAASMKAASGLVLLSVPAAFVGLIWMQAFARGIATQIFTRLQIKLSQRNGIEACSSSTPLKNLNAFVVVIVLSFLTAIFFFPAVFVVFEVQSAPDLYLAPWAAGASFVVSLYLTNALWQIHRTFRKHLKQHTVCQDCSQGLAHTDLTDPEQIRATILHPDALTKAEAIAINIGNVKYFAHRCLSCHPEARPGEVYLERHACKPKIKCPKCSQDTLESQTTQTSSRDYIFYCRTDTCHFCGHENIKDWRELKPTYSSGPSSYSSSSSSGSSSSSASFGGGSSGGGGAGGSW
ncbi:MAG: TPM domain-containing protein [Cyanobacteria bacterium P01_A01_bin.17]